MTKSELKKNIVKQLSHLSLSFVGNILNMLGVSPTQTFTQATLLNSGFSRKKGQLSREVHVKGDPENLTYVITTDHLKHPVMLRLHSYEKTVSGYAVYRLTTDMVYGDWSKYDIGEHFILDYETGCLYRINT